MEAAETLGKTVKVQVEYRAGTVWVESRRVASASVPKSGTHLESSHGWIDTVQIASILGTHEEEVKKRCAGTGTTAELRGRAGSELGGTAPLRRVRKMGKARKLVLQILGMPAGKEGLLLKGMGEGMQETPAEGR